MGRKKLVPVYVSKVEVQKFGRIKKISSEAIEYRQVIVVITLETDPPTEIALTVSGTYYPNEKHRRHRFEMETSSALELDHQWAMLAYHDDWKVKTRTRSPNIYSQIELAVLAAIEKLKIS